MNILVVTGARYEEPGLVTSILRSEGHDVVHARLEDLPDPASFDAVIVLASTAERDEEWVARVRWCVNNGTPYLGFETGALLLVDAIDGSATVTPRGYGWQELALAGEARQDPLFVGVPMPVTAMRLLGSTEYTGSCTSYGDALRVARSAYGLFGRIEATPDLLDQWIAWAPPLRGFDAEELRKRYTEMAQRSEAQARRLLTNFLRVAGP